MHMQHPHLSRDTGTHTGYGNRVYSTINPETGAQEAPSVPSPKCATQNDGEIAQFISSPCPSISTRANLHPRAPPLPPPQQLPSTASPMIPSGPPGRRRRQARQPASRRGQQQPRRPNLGHGPIRHDCDAVVGEHRWQVMRNLKHRDSPQLPLQNLQGGAPGGQEV